MHRLTYIPLHDEGKEMSLRSNIFFFLGIIASHLKSITPFCHPRRPMNIYWCNPLVSVWLTLARTPVTVLASQGSDCLLAAFSAASVPLFRQDFRTHAVKSEAVIALSPVPSHFTEVNGVGKGESLPYSCCCFGWEQLSEELG